FQFQELGFDKFIPMIHRILSSKPGTSVIVTNIFNTVRVRLGNFIMNLFYEVINKSF
ncbi:MAG: hypothetical protein ACD_35C00078G0001, partial [uncultured bacterium]